MCGAVDQEGALKDHTNCSPVCVEVTCVIDVGRRERAFRLDWPCGRWAVLTNGQRVPSPVYWSANDLKFVHDQAREEKESSD